MWHIHLIAYSHKHMQYSLFIGSNQIQSVHLVHDCDGRNHNEILNPSMSGFQSLGKKK